MVGPHVSNNEKKLVRMLHRLLIDRDFSTSSVYISPQILDYWKKAFEIYNEDKDYARFQVKLAGHWEIPVVELADHSDLIWTICNIYPHGRNVTGYRSVKDREAEPEQQIESSEPVTIKLRGFKEIY